MIEDRILGLDRWEVALGCPPAANLLVKSSGIDLDGLGAKVKLPSQHFLFVYYLPADSFGPEYELQTTEQLCIEYTCHLVTAGLYVNAEISDGVLREALLRSIGFASGRMPQDWFLMKNRDDLSICVDSADGDGAADADVELIEAGLKRALAAVPELPAAYDRHKVSSGCPAASAALRTPISRWDVYGRNVDEPSHHRLFVYLLSGNDFQATFPGESYVITSEEVMCSGDVCSGVTPGLYLSASLDQEQLRITLLRSLGLVSGLPNPEPDIDWTACERGARPHPDFNCESFDGWKNDLASFCEGAIAWPVGMPCEDFVDAGAPTP